MIVCTTLGPGGTVGGGLGKAASVAVAGVDDGRIGAWVEHEVAWDRLHDEGTEGSHHARIVTFLRQNDVELVVARGIGPSMQNTLGKMGVRFVLGVEGDARQAVVDAVERSA